MSVKFTDNSMKVIAALDDAAIAFLYEAAMVVRKETVRNTPVDTGQLKNSWAFNVDENKGVATIGSPLENAIWNEFGTGIHAVNGDGRQTPWAYQDARGEWHFTRGKKARKTLQSAYITVKPKIVRRAEELFKGRMGK